MNRGLKLLLFVLLPAAALGGAVWRFGMPTEAIMPSETASVPAPTVAASPPPPPPPSPEPAKPAEPTPVPPPAPSVLAPPATPAPALALSPAKKPDAEPPAFDLVRVEPDGSLVVAGRSSPDAAVALLRNGEAWDRATANATGQFAMTPKPLPAGTHELSLAATLPDGRTASSVQIVTVDVPVARGGDVVVALVAPDRPTQILSPPRTPAPAPAPSVGIAGKPDAAASQPEERRNVEIATVEQEVGGTFFAAGTAHPGATVRLYVNDSYLATATAGGDGKWSFSVGKGLTEGSYRVRLDDVRRSDGKVLSRAEVPFEFAARPPLQGSLAKTADPSTVVVPEVKTTTVARGDSLWRISQRIYGNGRRYIVIHRANEEQIRNPDLIYPGQVFVLPTEKTN